MSLTAEYFQEKQNEIKHYQKQGYSYLPNFLKHHKVHFDSCVELGLIRNKDILSTADFDNYTCTEKGKRYLKLTRYQNIFVKKNKAQLLAKLLTT